MFHKNIKISKLVRNNEGKMKLSIIMISCIGITALYCSEKRLNPDTVIRESWKTGGYIDKATVKRLFEEQQDVMKEQNRIAYKATIEGYIHAERLVPERIIEEVDSDLAQLARIHNQSLLEDYQSLEQLPQG